MNNDKRYRQISIAESFLNCKKPKNSCNEMEQNLRDLMAVAAEKRIMASNKDQTKPSDIQKASTSHVEPQEETATSEEMFVPSSQELFPDSEELLSSAQSVTEIPETPENDLQLSYSKLSAEIFEDSVDNGSQTLLEDENDSEDENSQILLLNRSPACSIPLPKLEPLENHFIMFSPHVRAREAPRPYPKVYRDAWDTNHVRMPCSPHNKYPKENINGIREIQSRWELICRSLRRPIETSQQLEKAIMQYNIQYTQKWNFVGLHAFFEQYLSKTERLHFFETILPVMIDIALDLPNICTQPPPLLKKDKDYKLTMSQKQIGCLLLNAFFCTFPCRNNYSSYRKYKTPCEYSSYPDINFNRLYFGVKNRISSSNAEKLKCLLNYFRRITTEEPTGTVTFHRKFFQDLPRWEDSRKGMKTAVIKSSGVIETDGIGMLQVDFANKFVGGGVLGHGCVQEEIRFVICPELIITRLFVQCLGPTEALLITGIEQYNSYSGYSNSFKWEGNFVDTTPRDTWGRKCTQVVAMDATSFRSTCEQYKPFRIVRELNKAYCGFYEDANPLNLSAIATGNWGCGAFNGNPILKFIIQLMVASEVNRDIVYFTFGNIVLKRQLQEIFNFFTEKNISVGDIWRLLYKFFNIVEIKNHQLSPSLFDFICSIFNGNDDEEEESYLLNTGESTIVNSEEIALQNLVQCVNENSDTDIEDSELNINDPG